MLKITYSGIEALPGKLDSNPADINPGGATPDLYKVIQWPGGFTSIIDGPANAAGLSLRQFDYPAGYSSFAFTYPYRVSCAGEIYSRLNENDIIFVVDGYWYNGSCQKVYKDGSGGGWYIVDQNGNWQPVGYTGIGLPPADTWIPVTVEYQLDLVNHTITVPAITEGTAPRHVITSPARAAVPAKTGMGWSPDPAIFWQCQSQTDTEAGTFSWDQGGAVMEALG